jgi:hypothetical protein
MRATAQARRNAAERAARQLMCSGLDCGCHLTAEASLVWLADVAKHIDSLDPITIGAAALLESSGYQRANVQLSLEIPDATSTI